MRPIKAVARPTKKRIKTYRGQYEVVDRFDYPQRQIDVIITQVPKLTDTEWLSLKLDLEIEDKDDPENIRADAIQKLLRALYSDKELEEKGIKRANLNLRGGQ